MSYEITLPNGEVVEVDDSIPPVQAAANIRKQRKDLFKTDLLSKEGITGLFSTMGEAIDASVLQAKQGMHQELLDAMQKDLGKYTPGTPEYKEQEQKILQQQQIAHEYAAGAGHLQQSINEQVPNPSMPLEAAMGVVPSLVNMAPAVVTRNPFPLAQQGLEQFRAGSYSQAREQGASPESASAYANIAGPMEAITEWMPIGKLFDSLGKEATRVIIAKTIGREVASEEVNTAVEHLAEQAHVTPDRPLNEFLASYGHKATVTALQAGMQTAVTAPLIAAANRTPGSTDPTPRVSPPTEEVPPPTTPPAEKPVPPTAPQFTDTQVDLAPLLPEIAALEAQVDAGLALPPQPIVSEPVEPSLSPEMQRLNARQASDTGITVEVLRNQDNFEDTNTAVPASERRVTRAMGIEGLAGLRWGETDLNKIKLTPGPVVVQVGEDSNVRPGHYMQGVVRDIYALAQEFNPEGKYVILPQDLATKAQREQAAQGGHFYQDGIHYIIPRWQTNQTEEGSHVSNEGKNKYSPYAKLDAYSTLGHEFGHSLIEDHFFQGLDANERTTLREVLDLGVPELAQALAGKLNPVAQKILADWAELRSATLENRISAKEAAMRWLSPSKLQKKVRQKELGFNAKGFTAQKFANRVGVQYQLSFDEYLAEQVAKAMFTAERMGKSETLKATFAGEMDNPQGLLDQMEARLVEFLGPLLETLQNLYSRLTAMGIAGPAQSSLEWLEQLGENARLAGERKAEGAKAKGTGKPVERPVKEPPTKNQHYATLRSLRAEGLVKTNSKVHRQLVGMLKRGDFEGFLREIEPLLGTKLQKDITDVESADLKGVQPAWIVGTGSANKWTPDAKFGKLSLKKVGSGEGTIWQGFGAYFGEAHKTYRYYRDELRVYDLNELELNGRRFTEEDRQEYIIKILERTPELTGPLQRFAEKMGGDETAQRFAVYTVYTEINVFFYAQGNPRNLTIEEKAARERIIAEIVSGQFNEPISPRAIHKAVKAFSQFKEVAGDRAVREFEVTAPAETFLRGDWRWEHQSDFVKAAIQKLPEQYKNIFMGTSWQAIQDFLDSDNWYLFAGRGFTFKEDTNYRGDVGYRFLFPNGYTDMFGAGDFNTAFKIFKRDLYRVDKNVVYELTGLSRSLLENARPTENAYWRMAQQVADDKGLEYYGERVGQRAFQVGKITSRILNSVGISGLAYLNHGNRGKHPTPPEFNEKRYNLVLYRDDLVKPLMKSARGKSSLWKKHSENTSRRLWREKGTASPNFQSWFAGSQAVTYDQKPLRLHFNTGLTFTTADGAEFYVGSENYMRMLEIADLATGQSPTPKQTRIIPGWLSIKNVKRLSPPEYGLTAVWLRQEAATAIREGHDGLVVYAERLNDSLWIGLKYNTATYNPDYKHTGNEAVEFGSQLRRDSISEEGHEEGSKWKLLKSKLNIPHLADGITALSNLQYWGLQMQQLGHMNPTWTWMMNFSSNLQKFYRKIGESHSRADAVVRQLQWFGKENLARMQKFTLAEYKGGEHWTELRKVDDQGHWEHVPTAKTYEKMREFGIDPESTAGKKFLRLYIEAKNALQFQMDEQQRVMYGLAARKYSSPTQIAERTQRFQEIALTYKLYRSIPFWPQHSFGKYRVQVWSSDALGKVLIYENATDSPTEAKEIEEAAQRKYPGKIVKSRIVTPNQALVSRLPTEFLDDLEVILELDKNNPDDMQKLQEIRDSMQSLYSKVPEQTYNPLKRIVDGGSTDFIKVFADFALRNANFIAKMEYRALLQQSISQAQREDEAQTFARKKAEIGRAIEFMQGTLNYAMDPQEEMATVRGIVAVSYLMLNVKTALLNFWGLTMTLAELNRELGYGKGAVTFGKAIWDATRTQGHEWGSFLATVMKGGADAALLSVTDPNWEMVNGQPTELRRALEQAKQENVLDQSYAYYLATQAMRGQLIRMASASLPGKMFKGSIDAGMSLFRGTELLIRRSTFLAMYKALQENQPELTEKERYEKAARMTSLLQGDYTKGNRPQIMRGQVMSFVTIFMTFVQTASWNAYGGMEIGLRRQEAMEGRASPPFYRSYTVQLVLLYLFAAGLEGLPGMENVLDILDALFKKWNDGKSARDGLRDMLVELDQDPMKWMRGMTFNLGGLDLSRSIGLGRVVPGTDVLATEHGKTKEFLGDFVGAASGIGGGYVQWVIDTMSAQMQAVELGLDQGSTLAKQVARMPGGIGNLFKAAQWAKIDARGPSGALLAYDGETQMAREIQYWEVTAKALGFQPASISRAQYIKGGQYDARVFWTARRKTLLDSLMQAQEIAKDREATADVRRAIEEFNKRVPSPGLRITSKTIEQSINRRRDAIEAAEGYSTVQKSLQDVYRQQLESFVESTE